MPLQTLDFAKFTHGSEVQKKGLARDLVRSLKNHGFAKFINYGISEEMTADMFKSKSSELFALSFEEKVAMANLPRDAPQRGWSRQGAETTAYLRPERLKEGTALDLKDEKEHFDCSAPDDTEYPNLWPRENALPGFREFMERFFDLCQHVSLQIIEAMEIGLDFPHGSLGDKCADTASELRLNHYPAVPLSQLLGGGSKRGWPHIDFGIITLVFQDHVGGLEMEDRSDLGTFVPVPPNAPGSHSELAVNISETFQRWANDQIPAGVHQVAPPENMRGMPGDSIVPERYTHIFFFKASRSTNVGPLPEFIDEKHPPKYEDMTALQLQRNRTAFLHSLHQK
ncbi:hypothetical protein PFICI_05762 [Pestalotiopsis fici W106-1]|uniref:Fe2OG dioxygenase domain-containing protein n=1 Tax=Pestalotiopsis fici (strain W106-1 / CGMCC3.15140) TaxID=1229662 RepID=W3XFA5_PESFW|nr:uncharacterized protein PFICI_05762 [Pestalotiopsis fici W106-1]ETS83886.1 hypothetical protein PFICI_05762 [Pestalotiopsis fici W106-1]